MAENLITNLPLYEDKKYKYKAILGNDQYTMQFWYNSRTKGWYFNVYQQENEPLVAGLKVLPNVLHGLDFSLSKYGIDGYFVLVPVSDNIKYEDIDSEFISQYYQFYYVEEV